MEITSKLPKKLLSALQQKYKDLFGLTQIVTIYEQQMSSGKKNDTYLLNISNRPIDILRLSTGQKWDMNSCMRLGTNPYRSYGYDMDHNNAMRGYIDYRSYVAFITKSSPYEPKWFSRVQMHRCHGRGDYKNESMLSVQHSARGYDVLRDSHKFIDIANDALRIILADKGVNEHCKDCGHECRHYWLNESDKNGEPYYDYTDNGGKCYNYVKNDNEYNQILLDRTKQSDDATKFVKRISNTF